jgi:hypothetical protein
MCCNPRKHGEKTMQEKKSNQVLREEKRNVYENHYEDEPIPPTGAIPD